MLHGASVADPYVKDAPGKYRPNPVIGSEPDLKAVRQCGHAFGSATPMVKIEAALLRGLQLGGCHREDEQETTRALQQSIKSAKPFLHHALTVFLEGTGSTCGFVGSYEEKYKATVEGAAVEMGKGAARMRFARAMKSKATPEHALLGEFVRVESQPDELLQPEGNRRADHFYRAIGHVISARVAGKYGPTFAHMIPVRETTKQRGAEAGAYVRGDPDLALLPIYARHISRAEWTRDHAPYFHAQLNQQPLFSIFFEPGATPPLRQGHVLSTKDLASFTMGGAEMTRHLDSLALGASVDMPESASSSLQLVLEAQSRPDLSLLVLTSPAHKVQALGAKKTAALIAALDKMVARGDLKGYALERSKPLPQCDDTVQVLAVLPVTSDAHEFPRVTGKV